MINIKLVFFPLFLLRIVFLLVNSSLYFKFWIFVNYLWRLCPACFSAVNCIQGGEQILKKTQPSKLKKKKVQRVYWNKIKYVPIKADPSIQWKAQLKSSCLMELMEETVKMISLGKEFHSLGTEEGSFILHHLIILHHLFAARGSCCRRSCVKIFKARQIHE